MSILQLDEIRSFVPSVEAIDFQGYSPLSKELTDLFQSVMDYKESIRGDKNLVAKVLQFHNDNVVDVFGKIVKKHTGLKVHKFINSEGPTLGYACILKIGKGTDGWKRAHDAVIRYSNSNLDDEPWYQPSGKKDDTVAILKKVSELLDLEKGKIKDSKVDYKNKQYPFDYEIYFCPYSAYLTHETIHNDVPQINASEVAAIMIHEIGHLISMVEHAGDLIRRSDALVNTIKKVPIKDLSLLAESLKRVKTKDKDLSNQAKEVATVAKNISQASKDSNIITRSLAVIGKLMSSVLTIAGLVCAAIMMRFFLVLIGSRNADLTKTFETKTGDFMTTFGDQSLCEQFADEYVSRHGLGGPLVSALGKLKPVSTAISMLSGFAAARESVLFYQICKFEMFVLGIMLMADYTGAGSYEDYKKRPERLLRNALKAFKHQKMPSDMLDYFIDDYEELQAAYTRALKDEGLSTKIFNINVTITMCLTLPNLINILTTGRIDKNYQKLINAIEEIDASEAYYSLSKLDQLNRRRS